MRGGDRQPGELFSYIDLEARVRGDHPLGGVREKANTALEMIASRGDRRRAITLGADRGYDARDFVMELRELNVRPHLAQNTSGRRSDGLHNRWDWM